ncbi:hypothetical protein ACQP1P_38525 [Dactylosporangium sp. CA-052675]|uniref:hypothetical protein n=1 Tax=Dactylosporangium sp. CA-052675 TaxID=3239927 RepID=UPI003D8AA6A8
MSPSRPKLADPGQLIRSAKRRTDTYDLCTDPDIVAEYEALLEEIAAEAAASSEKLSGGRTAELQQQLDDVIARGAKTTVTLTFQALPRAQFRALVDKHPPRKDDKGEIIDKRSARLGFEYDPFFAELIPLVLVSPELDEETLTILFDEVLTYGQWQDMTTVALNINTDTIDIPFSQAVSPKMRSSSPR